MKKFYFLVLLAFVIAGCSNSSNPVNSIVTHKPIFPQPGYNARNTSNPYCVNMNILPVVNGTADWSYTFAGTYFSDGSEFCVDSKGNLYYICQAYSIGGLYKFSQNGEVIWKKDSLIQYNFCGISLSSDEKKIYVTANKIGNSSHLYCIDSSGKDIWSIPDNSNSKPVIGKSGTIYNFHNGYLTALLDGGAILWQNLFISGSTGKYNLAIDGEDNIYVSNQSTSINKVDINGSIVWQYTTGFSIYGIVIDGYGNIYFNDWTNYKLYCLNSSGKLKWSKSDANRYSTPVITSDNKILLASGINVIAYDTAGAQIWKTQGLSNNSLESIILDDNDNVYYLGDSYNGILVGSISSSGVKKWEYISAISGTLPPPVLTPWGKLIFAPKRAYKIQALQ